MGVQKHPSFSDENGFAAFFPFNRSYTSFFANHAKTSGEDMLMGIKNSSLLGFTVTVHGSHFLSVMIFFVFVKLSSSLMFKLFAMVILPWIRTWKCHEELIGKEFQDCFSKVPWQCAGVFLRSKEAAYSDTISFIFLSWFFFQWFVLAEYDCMVHHTVESLNSVIL